MTKWEMIQKLMENPKRTGTSVNSNTYKFFADNKLYRGFVDMNGEGVYEPEFITADINTLTGYDIIEPDEFS